MPPTLPRLTWVSLLHYGCYGCVQESWSTVIPVIPYKSNWELHRRGTPSPIGELRKLLALYLSHPMYTLVLWFSSKRGEPNNKPDKTADHLWIRNKWLSMINDCERTPISYTQGGDVYRTTLPTKTI
jgi:hypothetical protein